MKPEEIANQLKAARKRAGLTQRDVADRMGSHVSFVQRIESNQGDRQISQLFRYAEAIGVTLGFYINEKDK